MSYSYFRFSYSYFKVHYDSKEYFKTYFSQIYFDRLTCFKKLCTKEGVKVRMRKTLFLFEAS